MLDGWRKTSLGELAEFRNGMNFTKSSQGASVKVIGVGDFLANESIDDFSKISMVTINNEVNSDDLLENDDLLFVRSNGNKALIGRCMILRNVTEPVTFSGFTIRARIASKDVDKTYISKLLQSPLFKEHLHRHGGGSSINNLNQGTLSGFSFLLPPFPKQRRISRILQTWDEAIEKLDTLRTLALKRRSWTRSNLLSGACRLGNFTQPWEAVKLTDVLSEHGQNSVKGDQVFSVSVHKGLINQVEHLGRSFSAANTDHYNRVLPGDIVYTKSPTGDFPLGIVKQSTTQNPVIVSPLYGVFTAETRALGLILDSLFESPVTVKNYLHPLVQKGAKNTISITNKRFLEGKLKLPRDQVEQEAIAEYILNDRAYVESINKEIIALKRQKRGLMQKLLTGEWRVALDSQVEVSA